MQFPGFLIFVCFSLVVCGGWFTGSNNLQPKIKSWYFRNVIAGTIAMTVGLIVVALMYSGWFGVLIGLAITIGTLAEPVAKIKTMGWAGLSQSVKFGGGFMASILVLLLIAASLPAERKSVSGIVVKANDYGDQWPLQTEEARLDCDVPDVAYIEVDGIRYALNGSALRSGLPRPDAIRKNNDSMFLADFTEKAMQVCIDKRK